MGLEKYFKGEHHWREYSSVFNEEWANTKTQQNLLVLLENKIDIAQVVHYHFKEESIVWVNSNVPALDGLTPLQCIKNEVFTVRLKELLMRMR